jgi:small subunit ribosomal protein S9
MATGANEKYFQGTGRRKRSIARVRISLGENNLFMVDGKTMDEKFPIEEHRRIVMEPLQVTEMKGRLNISVHVIGGGISGQAGAIRHGLSRALLDYDPNFRPVLKKAGFLTRDSREKERKKFGLFRARKKQQYSKR